MKRGGEEIKKRLNVIENMYDGIPMVEIINTKNEDDFLKTNDHKILVLENKIYELRNNLNELCGLADNLRKDNKILNMSQELDELIVEYMKVK